LDKTLLNIEGLGRQLYPQLDLWSTAKPFLEDLMKERYSMKNTFEKLKKEAPELLKEIPELPSLFINALKQLGKMKDINKLYAQQTNQIVDQLKDNANKQTSAIFAGSLLILSGVFAVNNSWIAGTISATVALIFWMKSR
jgi:ubiquinone biosynthesis protein